ncbi:hypothetical protein [Yoonia sp. 208BN28-4]|uniref:hypothetical protein n=1 Tax=Yoonia sp. 208BN28-4 TaxID=3126505 RepID=UPI0030A45A3D
MQTRFRAVLTGLILLVTGQAASAEAVTLLGQNTFLQDRGRLITLDHAATPITTPQMGGTQTQVARTGSLFAGSQTGSLFAPYPVRVSAPRLMMGPLSVAQGGSDVEQLRHLISQAESRLHGYDAVQHGARVRPSKRPTDMTLGEIYDWIAATPGQPHAIGRYQFIPATLRNVAARAGAGDRLQFTPALQDRLADELLADAGFAAFRRGQLGRHDFMNNLAKIWAGLPNDTGASHYEGYAGNSAAITWAAFDTAMLRIFGATP